MGLGNLRTKRSVSSTDANSSFSFGSSPSNSQATPSRTSSIYSTSTETASARSQAESAPSLQAPTPQRRGHTPFVFAQTPSIQSEVTIPSFTLSFDENGKESLQYKTEQNYQIIEPEEKEEYYGEQSWEPSSNVPGGQRLDQKHQRGVGGRASIHDQAHWKQIVQRILDYKFREIDLLEEALETKGNGIIVVGSTNRKCPLGNRSLAEVGRAIIELIIRDQIYLLTMSKGMPCFQQTFVATTDSG